MKNIVIFLVLASILLSSCSSKSIDYSEIKDIKKAFSSGSPEEIANFIVYPLKRRYPLPDIKDSNDFIVHFLEIFDQKFVEEVGNANLKTNWTEMGWRGIMYHNGEIWLSSDYKINAVNYISRNNQIEWKNLVNEQKKILPAQFQVFDVPIYEWNTDKYHYRLDKINELYRLLIFNKSTNTIIESFENGIYHSEGNMGFFYIDWLDTDKIHKIQNFGFDSNWKYIYRIYIRTEIEQDERTKPVYTDIERQ